MSTPAQVLQLQMALDQVERGPGELRGEARRGRSRVPHLWVSPQALEGAGNPRSQVSPALPCPLLVSLSVRPLCICAPFKPCFSLRPLAPSPQDSGPGTAPSQVRPGALGLQGSPRGWWMKGRGLTLARMEDGIRVDSLDRLLIPRPWSRRAETSEAR